MGMAGFSVGEITALIAAESMSLEQGILKFKIVLSLKFNVY